MAPGFLQATHDLRESVVHYVLQPMCGLTHPAGRKRPLPASNPTHDRRAACHRKCDSCGLLQQLPLLLTMEAAPHIQGALLLHSLELLPV